jgi:radical SAM superfamily enzyme YgiQ (UPF0313 family)
MSIWSQLDQQYADRMLTALHPSDRSEMASEKNCPLWLLRAFCSDEVDPTVVRAAVLNPICPDEYLQIAIDRFPNFNSQELLDLRKKRHQIHLHLTELSALEEEAKKQVYGDRDQIVSKHLLENKGPEVNSSSNEFTQVYSDMPWVDTSKYRIAMVMAPSWGVLFPPYNISKLTGMLRNNGYSVKAYDINIEAYHFFLKEHGEDYWKSERYFLWQDKENFDKYILPDLQPILYRIAEDIAFSGVRVVGFSLYITNYFATMVLVRYLKELVPDICFIVGGPETITGSYWFDSDAKNIFNYIFVGEAEETLLYTLETLPEEYPINKIVGSVDSRLDLDVYAYPDYSDYVLSNYLMSGASIETSRGCVAKCSFCTETHFWKFRSTTPERVVEEIEHQVEKYGIKHFWFVDSLVNGDIKNFIQLLDLLIEKPWEIRWNSYARCDGRMTEEVFKKIADSGCSALSFGVESGSQKVLDDMKKKIKVWEVEENFKHGKKIGMFNHANWMVGFPTEEPIDALHSLQLIYNCRKWVAAISPGFGASPSSQSDMDTAWQKYDIAWINTPWDNVFLKQWYTTGYKNTQIHRFVRLKLFHIWLEIIKDYSDSTAVNSQRYGVIKDFYKFNVYNNPKTEYLAYDSYVDFNQCGTTTLSKTVMNEYFGFVYALYLYYGKCEFEFVCDPVKDFETFGGLITCMYTAKVLFSVEENGDYKISITHSFEHDTLEEINKEHYAFERARLDQSFTETFERQGNLADWKTTEIQTKESVHAKKRREIPIYVK